MRNPIEVFFRKKYSISTEEFEKLTINFGDVYVVDLLIQSESIDNNYSAFENTKIKIFKTELNSFLDLLMDSDLDLALDLQDGKYYKFVHGLYGALTLYIEPTLPINVINKIEEISSKIDVNTITKKDIE